MCVCVCVCMCACAHTCSDERVSDRSAAAAEIVTRIEVRQLPPRLSCVGGHVHVRVWACGQVGMYVHMGMWACGHVGMWACGHVPVPVPVPAPVHAPVHACAHAPVHACAYMHMHTYLQQPRESRVAEGDVCRRRRHICAAEGDSSAGAHNCPHACIGRVHVESIHVHVAAYTHVAAYACAKGEGGHVDA